MPGAPFRHGLPGYAAGPYSTAWCKLYTGNRCTATTRRVGDRQADVVSLGPARWLVTITPVTPRHGRFWEACGAPVELGIFGGRKAGRAAADDYLATYSTST